MAPKAMGLGKGTGPGKGLGKDHGLGKGQPWPYNKKLRPAGSGTTSANRRAMRAGIQWSKLEGEDPGSVECLEKHEKALEAALEKTRAKKALEEERVSQEARVLKAKPKKRPASARHKLMQQCQRARSRSLEPKGTRSGTPAQGSEQGSLEGRLGELRQRLEKRVGRAGPRSRSQSREPTLEKVRGEGPGGGQGGGLWT